MRFLLFQLLDRNQTDVVPCFPLIFRSRVFFAVLAFNDMKKSNCKFDNETLFYPFLFASSCQGNEDGRAACVMLFLLLNPTGAKILF